MVQSTLVNFPVSADMVQKLFLISKSFDYFYCHKFLITSDSEWQQKLLNKLLEGTFLNPSHF